MTDPNDNPRPASPAKGSRDDIPSGGAAFRAPAPGSFTPRIRPATVTGEPAPAGSSLTTPTPAPLPARGAPLLLFITLAAALLAVTFTLLIALKL